MAGTRHAGGRPRILKYTPMGKRIVAEANRLGLAIDEVAEAAGVSRPTLYRILSGRIGSPRLQTVLAIAAALRTPASRLIGKGA